MILCRQYKALFKFNKREDKLGQKFYDVIDVIYLSLKIDRTVQVAGAAQRQDIPYLFQYTTGRNIKDNHIWFVPSIGLYDFDLSFIST